MERSLDTFVCYIMYPSEPSEDFFSSWPLFFDNPEMCLKCDLCSREHVLVNSVITPSKFTFIEFYPELMNLVTIHEETILNNIKYKLSAVIRNTVSYNSTFCVSN